jgi:hypothetical protein
MLRRCHSEHARIGDEMAKAYPYNHDFEIACRLNQSRAERSDTNGLTLDN